MATGAHFKITELVSLAIKKSGVEEATFWIRELISKNPGQAVLFNSEAKGNVPALIHGICFSVVSFFGGEETEQRARVLLRAIREVAVDRGLDLPKDSVDHIQAMKDALAPI